MFSPKAIAILLFYVKFIWQWEVSTNDVINERHLLSAKVKCDVIMVEALGEQNAQCAVHTAIDSMSISKIAS